MKARFKHDGKAIDFFPVTDVPAGSVIVQGSLVGITKLDIDFLINAADLGLIPQVGDRIISDNIVHEVLELGQAGCWCWCDPHGIRRRIHTRQLKENA